MFAKLSYYFKHRKLRFDILTLFFTLLTLSLAFVIIFSYLKTSDSILNFSKGTVQRVSATVSANIDNLVTDLEQVVSLSTVFATQPSAITPENQLLISYMLQNCKANPHLYALLIGTQQGLFLEVSNVALIHQTYYISDPSKPLPQGCVYRISAVDQTREPSTQRWVYMDKDFKVIGHDFLSPTSYDARRRPWYVEASQAKKSYWTDIFTYDTAHEKGMVVATPLFDPQGNLIAVTGAALSVVAFEDFLSQEKISKHGEVLIVNDQGEILLQQKQGTSLPSALVKKAFQHATHEQQKDFILYADGNKYLVSVSAFPPSFDPKWSLLVIVPFADFFSGLMALQVKILLISFLILVCGGILVVYFSKKISDPIVSIAQEVQKIQKLELDSTVQMHSNIREINLLDTSVVAMRATLRSFGRYVPKEIVKQLIQQGQEIALGGEKREITVLFTDIAGFTAISEKLTTELLMPLLAEYFDILSKIILEYQGTIDKYIGDSVMALWGAPSPVPQQTSYACLSALLCQAALAKLNAQRQASGTPPFYTRIGINAGTVIVGNIGTQERMNYTVIGDAVNLAARLQTLGKTYHVPILISEAVHKKISDDFLARPIDVHQVRGKTEKTKIYELVAKHEGPAEIQATAQQKELCLLFSQAFEAYHSGKAETEPLFQAILQKFPNDFPTQYYLQLLQKGSI